MVIEEPTLLNECQWPAVGDYHGEALHAAVEEVLARFEVLGIIAAGSVLRDDAGPTSDWDLFVINAQPHRQRIQKLLHQVPVEIFVNPPHTIRGYFADEHRAGRPCTAHMFVSGFVVLDRDPVVEELRREAEAWLDRPPVALSDAELTWQRYAAADILDNAWDIADTDPANASLLLYRAVDRMVDFAFRSEARYLPPPKHLFRELEEVDPILETVLRQFYSTADVNFQLSLAQRIAERTIGVSGFFEWESPLEEMPEDQSEPERLLTH